ncbi:hypothetical protein OUZ56_023907 [Daphnia magna]|uniref:Uncharacterized protein n=1 Tax=Daphnia magna TaxID=35525 RepID=A0ABR0AZS4_9CRUS|nr:hypothetical protein OUZ56_023907 [Daphnia magna]
MFNDAGSPSCLRKPGLSETVQFSFVNRAKTPHVTFADPIFKAFSGSVLPKVLHHAKILCTTTLSL